MKIDAKAQDLIGGKYHRVIVDGSPAHVYDELDVNGGQYFYAQARDAAVECQLSKIEPTNVMMKTSIMDRSTIDMSTTEAPLSMVTFNTIRIVPPDVIKKAEQTEVADP